MTSRQQRGSGANRTPQVVVMGWQERLRAPLAEVIAQQDQLGSTLQQVRFEASGCARLHWVMCTSGSRMNV